MLATDVDVAAQEPPPGDAPSPTRLGYQPALDGLRAIAVAAVMLYHGGVDWASGGYLGVDVFFVLSGFLITTLLVEEWRGTATIGVRAFYSRRARRLFPALVPVLVAVALYGVFLAPSSQLAALRTDVLATLGYVMNWHLVVEDRGYFDAFAGLSPLSHTWSLAVEEQWYLVWPVAVLVLLGRRHREGRLRLALVVTAGLCVASALWMALLADPGTDPSRVYYGTDTRAQELLLGAALAFGCAVAGGHIVARRARATLGAVGIVALAALVALVAVVDDGTRWTYEGGMLLLSALVGVIVLAAVQPDGVVRAALGVAPLRVIGLLSYGLYLWHIPVYLVATGGRTGLHGTALLLVRLTVTGLAAAASYRLVERGVRLRRISNRRLLVAGPLGVALALVLVHGVAPGTIDGIVPPALASPSEAHERTGDEPAPVVRNVAGDGDIYTYDPSGNPAPELLPGEDTTRVVVTGDSVALTLSNGFQQRTGDPPVVLWDQSVVGCSLFRGVRVAAGVRTDGGTQCEPWRADRGRWLAEFRPHVVAVLSGVWETYDREVDGVRLEFGTPQADRWFSAELDRLVAETGGAGARLALLTAPCNRRAEDLAGHQPPENDAGRREHLNGLLRAAASRHPDDAVVVDLGRFVCPDGVDATARDGVTLRADDGVHFRPEGADVVRRWLFPRLDALRPGQ